MLKNKILESFKIDEYLEKSKECYELSKNIDMLALVEELKQKYFEKQEEVCHLRFELATTRAELKKYKKEEE